MLSWLHHNKLKLSGLLLATVTFLSYQNCAKMSFQQASVDQASKTEDTNLVFSCSQPSTACEVNSLPGTMTCIPTDSGPVWGPCVLPLIPGGTTTTTLPGAKSCTFRGVTYLHGQSFIAYQADVVAASGTCVGQQRTCINGSITGSYQFLSCVKDSGQCSLGGQNIAHNTSITAYSANRVPFGQVCLSESRLCKDRMLSGSYPFLSCVVDPAANCNFNGQVVAHSGSVTAYQTASVPFGQTCQMQTRVCTNGNLSGSYLAASCTVQPPANCNLNGQTILHGGSAVAYQAATVPFGQTCQMQTRVCTNGNLSGSYAATSCSVDAATYCSLNGQIINHTASVTTYKDSVVPFGSTCVAENRTCNNGSLSGSFAAPNCTVQAPANCNFNGQVVAHGQSVTAYSQTTVAYGASCSSVAQTRTCSNGSLSGDAGFNGCSVLPPANCSFNGQTVIHGQSIAAFQNSSVTEPDTCVQENRVCDNGNLNGNYAYPSCTQTVNIKNRHFIYSACARTNNGQTMACGYADPGLFPEKVCSGNILLGGYYGHQYELSYMYGVGPDQIFPSLAWSVLPPLANVPGARCVVSFKQGYGYAPPFGEQFYHTIYFSGDPLPGALSVPNVIKAP